MIYFKQSGNFKKTENFFKRALNSDHRRILHKYGKKGVDALQEATPKATGKTSESWSYKIENKQNSLSVSWYNSNIVEGVPIALVIQYGRVTEEGVYLQGRDYINPALQDIFDKMANELWKEVTKS